MTPRLLAKPLHSLPPILHIIYSKTTLSYSKGSRGLFVPSRVPGIFTGTTISPSSWLRQCPSRYTIRAGRNLPDKEFRYLRTVIVTAAVYWGFGSALARPPLTFQHRAGVRPYTSSYDFAESCVFAKQSPGPFHCGSHCYERLFSRSYEAILPNSLAMIHSSALGYSPRPPVSVYGTGCIYLKLRGFSWKPAWGHYQVFASKNLYYRVSAQQRICLLYQRLRTSTKYSVTWQSLRFSVTPSQYTQVQEY